MSTNFKNKLLLFLLGMVTLNASSQFVTIELPRTGTGISGQGPSTANVGPISLVKDPENNGTANFETLMGTEITNVTFKLSNQQYTGLTYTGLSTGLVFAAGPTNAVALAPFLPGQQTVEPRDFYETFGSFLVAPGGPTANFYSSHPVVSPGVGIVTASSGGSPNKQNGAVTLFTAAQVQYDQGIGNNPAPVPTVFNSTTKYYYGDFTIQFNRYIANPVIHIAGLGGAYFYLPIGASPASDPNNWRRTHFTSQLEGPYNMTLLSGNSFFNVSSGIIGNSAAKPDGASVSTTTSASDPFNHLGAASGSVRINGVHKTLVFKIYLKGSDITDPVREFAWSAPGSASNNDPATLRNPLTGDIWSVSVSTEPAQLIPLPATGLNLTAALNGNDVQLKWKTISEANSDKFEIERSTDGVNYSQIGVKQAAGYSTTESNYSHVDPNMTDNARYYRVKLVDFDGKASYSNVAIVRKSGGIKGMKIFPNPVVNQLNLEFTNMKGSHTVSLYNINGQEVVRQVINVNSTVQYFTLVKNSLPAGSYIIKVKSDDNQETYSEKVIFQ